MADSPSDILLSFLQAPLNRQAFNAFFDQSYRRTMAYLRSLRYCGHRLPFDDRTDTDPLADLAIDVLGEVMAPLNGRLCPGLFDYLERQEIREFRNEDAERLLVLFRAFLRGRIRQRLSRLRMHMNPEAENLKRRTRDVLKELGMIKPDQDLVGPPGEPALSCSPRPALPRHELHRIIEEAFLCSTTRKGWCEDVFRRIEQSPEYSPQVPLHELLATMVEVNARFMEGEEFGPAALPEPEQELLRRQINAARIAAVDATCERTIQRFIAEQRLTNDEGVCIQRALQRYMEDFCTNGDTDKIPEYFREVMPPDTHNRYLRDYKYLFESILADARKHLRDNLENNRQ